jgi:sugar-specific transcriptional regulator TrmB
MLDDTSLSLLKNTRLNDKQARVYLALLQSGPSQVSRLAEIADLKRSTTYLILDELVQLGLASESTEGKKKSFAATDPSSLATQLERTARDFKEMLPYLHALQRQGDKPYARYYKGLEGIQAAFQEIRKPKEARYMTSINVASKLLTQEVKRWEDAYRSGKAGPGGRHLLTQSEADRAYGENIAATGQEVRYLPSTFQVGIDVAIVEGRVYITSFEEEVHTVIIDSEPLFRLFVLLFDTIWESSKSS